MLFGLKITPATFQRAIAAILWSVKWQSALVYFEDIVVVLKNAKKNMARLQQVLTLLPDALVTLMLEMCSFFAEKVNNLWRVIRPDDRNYPRRQPQLYASLRTPLLRRN